MCPPTPWMLAEHLPQAHIYRHRVAALDLIAVLVNEGNARQRKRRRFEYGERHDQPAHDAWLARDHFGFSHLIKLNGRFTGHVGSEAKVLSESDIDDAIEFFGVDTRGLNHFPEFAVHAFTMVDTWATTWSSMI